MHRGTAVLMVLVAAAVPAAARADVRVIPTPSAPVAITAGPDGNVWYAGDLGSSTNGHQAVVGRITPSGAVTEFPLPDPTEVPRDITAGPDGNLWYTRDFYVGKVTPAGAVTEFLVLASGLGGLQDIVDGGDGALWFTSLSKIGRIAPDGTTTSIDVGARRPTRMIRGPDGNFWFVDATAENGVERMTPAGAITHVAAPSDKTQALAVGPDGRVWLGLENRTFETSAFDAPALRRVTAADAVETVSYAPYNPVAMVAGPDGNLWIGQGPVEPPGLYRPIPPAAIGRVSAAGAYTGYCLPGRPRIDTPDADITAGPDGAIWSISGTLSSGVDPQPLRNVQRTTTGTPVDIACQAYGGPPPQAGKSVVVEPVKGTVKIKPKGATRFTKLTTGTRIPVGSQIDTRRGTVRLTSIRNRDAQTTQTADFYDALWRVGQDKKKQPFTEMALSGPLVGCPSSRASAARRRGRGGWGRGKGRFRTRGRGGAATVRGTTWFTQDRCDGTFFLVRRARSRCSTSRRARKWSSGRARATSRG